MKKFLSFFLIAVAIASIILLTSCNAAESKAVKLERKDYILDRSILKNALSLDPWPYSLLQPNDKEQITLCREIADLA